MISKSLCHGITTLSISIPKVPPELLVAHLQRKEIRAPLRDDNSIHTFKQESYHIYKRANDQFAFHITISLYMYTQKCVYIYSVCILFSYLKFCIGKELLSDLVLFLPDFVQKPQLPAIYSFPSKARSIKQHNHCQRNIETCHCIHFSSSI